MNDSQHLSSQFDEELGRLRTHVLQMMEKAEVCDDPEKRRWYLSFVVVGGGYSGVESAGEINDLVRGTRRLFRNVRSEDVRVTLVHSRAQILPEGRLTISIGVCDVTLAQDMEHWFKLADAALMRS